jgi:hypothetical protein
MITPPLPRRNRVNSMHRVMKGYYIRREPSGLILHVFRFAGSWYYCRAETPVPYVNIIALYLGLSPWTIAYPTYRMALNAAQGNRVP